MLLVGITGPVGSGKTSLLLQLTAWFHQQYKGAEGFLAIGENRPFPDRGANVYRLQMVASGRDLLYATRDESQQPPYVFNTDTDRYLREWAEQLKMSGAPPLIVLDEFSGKEASGKGHTVLWDSIKSSNPPLVVIALRSGLVADIENVLQTQFDVCVDVQEKDAWNTLRKICVEHEDWKRVGAYGAAAGSFEASVGTMLHTAHVPFRGIALSSVQSMVMTFAGDGLGTRGKVIWVPFISAGIKALSPSGSRLNPMLAISVQGILFTVATEVLGWNVLGIAIGGFLIGAWAAAQGVVLQMLFVGGDLVRFYDTALQWIARFLHLPLFGLIGLLVVWSSIAGLFSSIVTVYTFSRRHRTPARLQRLLAQGVTQFIREETERSWKSTFLHSLHDLSRPYFWIPIAVLMVLIFITGSSLESIFWIAVRASTIAMVFFSLARAFDPRSFLHWLRKRGYWGPAYAFRLAFLSKRKEKES
jgi:nucleoside-triphosphatase THEP1